MNLGKKGNALFTCWEDTVELPFQIQSLHIPLIDLLQLLKSKIPVF